MFTKLHNALFPWLTEERKETMMGTNDTPIERIKTLTTTLTARDAVVNEILPEMIEEAVKILNYIESTPKTPYRTSLLVIDNPGGPIGEHLVRHYGEITNSPMSVSLCTDADCAHRLYEGREFDVALAWERIDGLSAADIAEQFEEKDKSLPFILVSNGSETREVSLEHCRNVYMVIDDDTARNSKALEIACKQTIIRHKARMRIKASVEELVRLFGVMERVKCQLVT